MLIQMNGIAFEAHALHKCSEIGVRESIDKLFMIVRVGTLE